jgi:hypothetical protein
LIVTKKIKEDILLWIDNNIKLWSEKTYTISYVHNKGKPEQGSFVLYLTNSGDREIIYDPNIKFLIKGLISFCKLFNKLVNFNYKSINFKKAYMKPISVMTLRKEVIGFLTMGLANS